MVGGYANVDRIVNSQVADGEPFEVPGAYNSLLSLYALKKPIIGVVDRPVEGLFNEPDSYTTYIGMIKVEPDNPIYLSVVSIGSLYGAIINQKYYMIEANDIVTAYTD